jgi:hypothetical protein
MKKEKQINNIEALFVRKPKNPCFYLPCKIRANSHNFALPLIHS